MDACGACFGSQPNDLRLHRLPFLPAPLDQVRVFIADTDDTWQWDTPSPHMFAQRICPVHLMIPSIHFVGQLGEHIGSRLLVGIHHGLEQKGRVAQQVESIPLGVEQQQAECLRSVGSHEPRHSSAQPFCLATASRAGHQQMRVFGFREVRVLQLPVQVDSQHDT